MNLPILFKPIIVEADVPKGILNKRTDDYYGFWVDGGLLNNFPLHAFDYLESNGRSLNPYTLGLRLTDGKPNSQLKLNYNKRSIFTFLTDMLFSLLYPSEEGQILNDDERDQTIELYTYDLETTEFAPSTEKRKVPIRYAEQKVSEEFSRFFPWL